MTKVQLGRHKSTVQRRPWQACIAKQPGQGHITRTTCIMIAIIILTVQLKDKKMSEGISLQLWWDHDQPAQPLGLAMTIIATVQLKDTKMWIISQQQQWNHDFRYADWSGSHYQYCGYSSHHCNDSVAHLRYIYSTAKEMRKFVTLKLITNKICWIQEIYITCKTNCILYS